MKIRTVQYHGEVYVRNSDVLASLSEAKIVWLELLAEEEDVVKKALIKAKISTIDFIIEAFAEVKFQK